MPKILQIVNSCGECPHYGYSSDGQYECDAVREIVVDKTMVASFCPLTDFPSRTLADMDATIRFLRAPNKYGFILALLSHIATKLNEDLSHDGAINIPLKDGSFVYLRHDSITEIVASRGAVFFVNGRGRFKLHPDATPPELYQQITREGVEDELWDKLHIAI